MVNNAILLFAFRPNCCRGVGCNRSPMILRLDTQPQTTPEPEAKDIFASPFVASLQYSEQREDNVVESQTWDDEEEEDANHITHPLKRKDSFMNESNLEETFYYQNDTIKQTPPNSNKL